MSFEVVHHRPAFAIIDIDRDPAIGAAEESRCGWKTALWWHPI